MQLNCSKFQFIIHIYKNIYSFLIILSIHFFFPPFLFLPFLSSFILIFLEAISYLKTFFFFNQMYFGSRGHSFLTRINEYVKLDIFGFFCIHFTNLSKSTENKMHPMLTQCVPTYNKKINHLEWVHAIFFWDLCYFYIHTWIDIFGIYEHIFCSDHLIWSWFRLIF